MAFSSALRWWEEGQLHVLVLGSLAAQLFLASFAGARKSHIRPTYRFAIWLAYLSGDALAIYALAILYNRQKKLRYKDGSHDLEVLWAPVLLMHLGGPTSISAYNIEDNELWRRHILTMGSQVAIALYVFCKSWPFSADGTLSAVAVMVFITGVSKCLEKPLGMRRASFNSLVCSFHPAPRTGTTDREVELEEFIQDAKYAVQHSPDPRLLQCYERQEHMDNLSAPDKLFVDSAYTYPERLDRLKSLWLLLDEAEVRLALYDGISGTFNLIYTKDIQYDDQNRRSGDCDNLCSFLVWLVTLALSIIPAIFFTVSPNKKAYRGSDVKVTYALYATYFLEFCSKVIMSTYDSWHDKAAQHSLVGLLARKRKHATLVRIAQGLQCQGLLDQYFCPKPCRSSIDLIRSHVRDGWINYIRDAESYRKFGDIRGHWTLERNGCQEALGGSIEKPFDESIVLWHLATDFCFHHKGTYAAKRSREISNYMMHLLFANPEMLMPGSRGNLFKVAYSELEAILQGDDNLSLLDERQLTEKIIDKVESREGFLRTVQKEGFIHDAWVIAGELMRLGDEKKMWEVITGVWVEMLCYSAGRCRGYLHAKSLGSGGEHLTFVSLLMSHAGLETFSERQQRVQLRLPNEVRMHIVRIRSMKKEIEEAARNKSALSKNQGNEADAPSPEHLIAVS